MAQSRDRTLQHDDLRRATHEAGHVVVALVVDWPFEYVTIDRDPRFPNLIGHVQYRQAVRRYSELRAWGATFLGGREAEEQLLGSFGVGSLEDERLVADVLAGSFPSPRDRRKIADEVIRLSSATVANHISQVTLVRDALIARRRLRADDVQSLIGASTNDSGRCLSE